MWAFYQPRGIRYTHDLLGSVCNRAKLGGCTYDVLVLIIANYDRLQIKTTISMASGVKDIRPIWRTLGPEKEKALPRLYAFTETDNTGRYFSDRQSNLVKTFLGCR